jgi:CheY-like chemotaxis protein
VRTAAQLIEINGFSDRHFWHEDYDKAALAIIKSGVGIDLLFTDIVMPGGLRAPDLARKAQETRPGLVVLFTTGYADAGALQNGRLDGGINLITKPYTREELGRKLRHVLRKQ